MYETPRFAIAAHGATNMSAALPTKNHMAAELAAVAVVAVKN